MILCGLTAFQWWSFNYISYLWYDQPIKFFIYFLDQYSFFILKSQNLKCVFVSCILTTSPWDTGIFISRIEFGSALFFFLYCTFEYSMHTYKVVCGIWLLTFEECQQFADQCREEQEEGDDCNFNSECYLKHPLIASVDFPRSTSPCQIPSLQSNRAYNQCGFSFHNPCHPATYDVDLRYQTDTSE